MTVHHYNEERPINEGSFRAIDPMLVCVAALGDDDVPPDSFIVRVQPFGVSSHTRLVFGTDRDGVQVLVDMLSEALAAGPQPFCPACGEAGLVGGHDGCRMANVNIGAEADAVTA
jgi:hypothetical protein